MNLSNSKTSLDNGEEEFHGRALRLHRILIGLLLAYFSFEIAMSECLCAQTHSRTACKGRESVATITGGGREIVENLVNRNPTPVFDKAADQIKFDKKFDWAENKRVWLAIRILPKYLQKAWPELVNHLDDDRYCITVEGVSGAPHNWTVGTLCRLTLERSLAAAYYRHIQPESLNCYWLKAAGVANSDNKSLKVWLQKRSGNELYQLQVEACEWAISEIDGLSDERLEAVPAEQRHDWVAAIKKEIASLQKSKTPVRYVGFGPEEFLPATKDSAKEDNRK